MLKPLSLIIIMFVSACGGSGSSPATPPPVSIDTTPPNTPTISITQNTSGTVSISGSAEANSSVTITFPDGQTSTTNSTGSGQYGPVTSELPQPNGEVSTTATDQAGNTSTPATASYNDIQAPFTPIITLLVNPDNRITISGSAEALSLVTASFEDGTSVTSTSSATGIITAITSAAPQPLGEVTVSATDINGNLSDPVTREYEIFFIPENDLHELVEDPVAIDVVRFLTQSTFGPTENAIQRLVADDANYADWIEQQISTPLSSVLFATEQKFLAAGLPIDNRNNLDYAYPKQLLLSDALWETFAYGDDQLRQRVAFALSQIFVVSEVSDTLFNDAQGVASYHDMLAELSFANFRDLLQAVTLHPIMGEYLSMIRNEKANTAQNIRPDENYARELMQLFSIGLVMLNPDGSVQLDNQGQPIATYTQEIVKSFARVFTGWTYSNATYWGYDGWLTGNMTEPMMSFELYHDTDEKLLFNNEILPSGQSAQQDLEDALDNIFNHPNVAPFISKQLIQKLVTSNPSPDYVARISSIFTDNGNGVRGDLAAVVNAILLDTEARTGQLDSPDTFGKIKEPLLKFTALIRAFDVIGTQPINDSGAEVETLRFFLPSIASGQKPYGSPSVFNFFRPEHSPPGAIRNAGLLAPEAQILNEYYITEATNYGSGTIFNSYDFLLNDCVNI